MTRLSYRTVALAAVPLILWVPITAWRQESERGIAFAVHAPAVIAGFPVTAAGFESLHGELLEGERLRREERQRIEAEWAAEQRAVDADPRVVECDDLAGFWPGSFADQPGCRVVGRQKAGGL